MNDRAASIAVIGGGVAGLVAAYRLLQQGHSVHIFEAGPAVGGLLRTFEPGGDRLECFYHHLFTSDGAAIRLLGRAGPAATLSPGGGRGSASSTTTGSTRSRARWTL